MSYNIPTNLYIFTRESSKLDIFYQEFKESSYYPKDIDTTYIKVDIGFKEKNFLDAIDTKERLTLILTDLKDIQRFAVKLKLKSKYPTVILKWWDILPTIENSYKNRLIFNRYTGVNFIQSKSQYQENSKRGKNILKLDNPVLLEQRDTLGDFSHFKMMKHTLTSLTKPSRVDIFGRKKDNYSEIRLTVATHFYINQSSISTVITLLEHYSKYDKELLKRIQFVIVDDGSPIEYKIPDFDLNLTWIRINQDIKWNQAGAKNLAMLYARSNNVVISDIDHLFPEHTLKWLTKRDIKNSRFYKFYRRTPDGKTLKAHPNLFYISRGKWFELFGMDEEFSGAYGAEDFRFVKHFKNHGTILSYAPKRYYCKIRDLDRDNSYHSLVRDLSFNTPIDTRKRLEANYFGKDYGYSRSFLNFKWDILLDKKIKSQITPKIDRLWRPLWIYRQIINFICRK